jgi:hypothetical protein
VVVEVPTAPAAALIALYHLGVRPTRRVWLFLGVAAVPAIALALYLGHAFGSPVRVGYDLLSDPASRAEMRARGVFGLTWPKPSVMAELLIGRDRGLFPFSPVLLLAFPGFLRALARPGDTASPDGVRHLHERDVSAMRLAAGVSAYFLLFVSSYEWWQGGAGFGSRHLGPMLPFLALPIALVAEARPRLGVAVLVPSIAFMTIVTSVQPKPSERYKSPFWDYELPAFVRGDLSASNACPVIGSSQLRGHTAFLPHRNRDAFNVGMLIGGSGHRSLVPLFGLWVASAWVFARGLESRGRQAEPAPADA